jgi:hypothetical protein
LVTDASGHGEVSVTSGRSIEDDRGARSSGWLAFAAAMLAIGGVFKIFDALWAFKYDDDYPQLQTILFERDLAAWGWVWLIVGVLLLVTAACVVTGSAWARWFGIVAAAVAAITFMPWIYYNALWTMLSVSLMILTIYALAAHAGRREAWV